jgi:Uma2 family endonuclease
MAMPAAAYPPPSERRGPYTEADLDQTPADGYRYEIIDGSLHVTPPASDDHNECGDDIRAVLKAAAPPGWRAIHEVGIRTPAGNLVPDVAVLRPGAERGVIWREASDVALAVEIESPTTRRFDRRLKGQLYADAGIPAYWRVEQHPDGPQVHVYELTDDGSGADRDDSTPLPFAKRAYTHVAWVRPGMTWQATVPFPVTIDPGAWTG